MIYFYKKCMTGLNKIYNMDCIIGMKSLLADNSIDAIITDPPYELGFMGKARDKTGIAYNVDMRKEALRVLKPGGYLLAFSGTRTYHRMASAIEDAGFEVRDMIEWVYGSGFPKSLNIGKVLDKFLKTGNASWNGTGDSSNGALGYAKLQHKQGYRPNDYSNAHQNKNEITEELAKQWEGWGTALKPAHEPICMARKPLSEKTVAENCLKWGTGGINIDESRVETQDDISGISSSSIWSSDGTAKNVKSDGRELGGRFPANLIHDNSEEVKECFPESKSTNSIRHNNKTIFGNGKCQGGVSMDTYGHNDSGNASRFFKSIVYTAKASKSDRGDGNTHATVKPTELMEYLIKMTTKEGYIVLDPFMGSGTTAVACKKTMRQFIGFELELEHCNIANNRLKQIVSLF